MEAPLQPPVAEATERGRRRARCRALVAFAALVVALHAALLGSIDPAAFGPGVDRATNAPMTARMVAARATPAAEVVSPVPVPAPVATTSPTVPPPTVARATAPVRRPRPKPSRPPIASVAASSTPALPASEDATGESVMAEEKAASAAGDAASSARAMADSDRPDLPGEVASAAVTAAPAAPSEASVASAPATFLAAGESPPPTYRTVLPPSTVMHYEVRRGFLRGRGDIRWQHVGDDYGLRLEAKIAGLLLLAQTSQGVVDDHGLAPVRFLDQRARRAPQAANFRRESQTVTFSGPSTVWPLLPGTQDQLSWMIQLAGIVAADPARASEGSRISMVIVGARGDAGVRTLRFAGRESAQTARASVPALKFVVDARSAYDSGYEIWLDPGRFFLPVHATRRNAAGDADFDLLLEDMEPIP